MILDSPIISGSSTVTGDLTVLGTLTANVSGSVTSASYATNAETLDGLDSTSFTTTSSFTAYTASTNASILSITQNIAILYVSSSLLDSRVTRTEATASSLTTASSSFSTRVSASEASISVLTTASSSFSTRTTNLETASGSFSTRTTNLETASGSFSTRVTNAESSITSLNSRTGSFATTGSNRFIGNQTVTGSLTITENLTVLGSSSISYVSQSTLNIGTNLITVNAQNPSVRFGGLAVIDSGSVPQVSGSWLFDSIQNRWIMIHQQTAGVVTSSIAIMGPETYNNLGSETQITQNRLVKGVAGASGEHIGDSNISDTGTVVSINSATQVTGSLDVTGASTFASTISATQYTAQSDTAYYRVRRAAGTDVGYIADSGTWGDSGTDFSIGASSTNLRFYTNNSVTERMRLDSAGRLGIGTTSLSQRLHVDGAIRLTSNPSVTGDGVSVHFWNQAGVGATIAAANFQVQTNGTSVAMHINSSQNVGIGTTSPSSKLQVIVPAGLFNASIANQANLSGSVIIQADSSGTMSRASLIMRGSDSIGGAISVAREDPGSTWRTYMAFYTNNLTVSDVTAIQEKMRITSDGNVGIGTTSPTGRLNVITSGTGFTPSASGPIGGSQNTRAHFQGGEPGIMLSSDLNPLTGVQTGNQAFQLGLQIGFYAVNDIRNQIYFGGGPLTFVYSGNQGASVAEYMRVATSGNVGIGTTSPATILDVNGNTTVRGSLAFKTTGTNNGNLIISDNGGGTATINNSANSFLNIASASSTSITAGNFIVSGGNVGIGTTNPSTILDVRGGLTLVPSTSLPYENIGDNPFIRRYVFNNGNMNAGQKIRLTNTTSIAGRSSAMFFIKVHQNQLISDAEANHAYAIFSFRVRIGATGGTPTIQGLTTLASYGWNPSTDFTFTGSSGGTFTLDFTQNSGFNLGTLVIDMEMLGAGSGAAHTFSGTFTQTTI